MSDPSGHDGLRVAGWDVDVAGHALRRAGREVHLEPRALQVLLRLAAAAPAVVSRRSLRAEVWGDDYVGEDAISATVIKLRRAFGDDARHPTVIQTVPKSGYRLIGPVERRAGGDGAAARSDEVVTDRSDPRATSGGRRVASVLRVIVDVADAAGDEVDPQDWATAMRTAVDGLSAAVAAHGGWTREESTGLVAVFGAPTASEHHVERALRAALDLGTSSADVGPGLLVSLRSGVASGPVVTVAEGRGATAIYGATVRVASLLAEAAAPGEVLVCAPSVELRDAAVGTRPLERSVPGVPGRVCRLVTVEHRSGLWETRQRLGLPTLRGRAEEVDRLAALLGRAAAGRGQAVSVTGEPGVGKSRLLFEVLGLARQAGFETYVGQASPLDRHSPYFCWAGLLESVPDVVAGALVSPDADRLALESVRHPQRIDPEWAATDPEVRHARTVSAVVDLLTGHGRPTLVALEDVHWCDEASRVLLEGVAGRIARRPVLLVTTRRPAEPVLAPAAHVSEVWVQPLTTSAAAGMLDELTGSDATLDTWKQVVLASAGGTPLFLEECVRAALATGALLPGPSGLRRPAEESANPDLRRGGGRRSLDAPGRGLTSVPASVEALLAERIDLLPAEERTVVSAAAVLGAQAAEPLVRAVAAVPEELWLRVRDRLHSSDLLYETTAGGRLSLVFNHALTRDVAYRGIRPDLRRELHARAAAELSSAEVATPEVLAWHLQEAGSTGPAVTTWVRAAQAASHAGAFEDTLVHLDRAGELLARLSPGPARDRAELEIELARGAALVQSVGPTDEAVERAYERARRLAGRDGSPQQQFTALWGSWFVHLMRGDLAREREFGARIADLAAQLDDDDALSLEAHHVQWSGLTLAGRPREAAAHSDLGIARYDRRRHHWLTFSYGGHDPGVCALNLNALARWVMAEAATAGARAEEALALADELGHPYSVLEATQARLVIALLERDPVGLEEPAARLEGLVADGRLPDVTGGYARGFLGAAAALRGDLDRALVLLNDAAPVWREFWGAWCFPLDGVYAEVLQEAGQGAAALAHVERTLAWADRSGGSWWSAELHRQRARLRAAGGEDVRAELAHASSLAQRQGAVLLELRTATTALEMAGDGQARAEATRVLADVVGRIPEGPAFRDLVRARDLLAAPAGP